MSALFSQIFSLLTAPPGNLVYHLVLVFSVASALQVSFAHWRSTESPQVKRTMLGLGLLLGAQVLLFGLSALSWPGIINPSASLPPLDRAFTLFSIVWITWLWVFPEPNRNADLGAGLLSLLIAAAALLSLLTWAAQSSSSTFNQSSDDLLWQAATIALIIAGVILLLLRRPIGFGTGLAVLGIALLGHLAYLLMHEEGNYSGVIRLAYIAVYPILLILPQRFPASGGFRSTAAGMQPSDLQQNRSGVESKTLQALLDLASSSDSLEISKAITCSVARIMFADLCCLVTFIDDKSQMVFSSGYDLTHEKFLDGGGLTRTNIPKLTNAIQRGQPLRLSASSTSTDNKGLADFLGLGAVGNILSIPIVTEEKESLGGIIVCSPFSNRQWTTEDQAYLAGIAPALVPILRRAQRVTKLNQQIEQASQTLYSARGQIAELERRNVDLSQQIEELALQSDKDATKLEELAILTTAHEQSLYRVEQLETDLNMARKDLDRLQNEPANSKRKGFDLEKGIDGRYLATDQASLNSDAMDLNLIIDNALVYTSSQVREKNISMHLDLPKKVAPVIADREALEQILIHLLENAGEATPEEGTIRLKVQTTTDDGQAYVLIQVTDSGGGIPEEDFPRVFTRLYRAENEPIQGLGDSGVGLSVAKTLTEAQHGRIWVESEKGVSSTFSVLFPIESELTNKPFKKGTG